MSNITTRAGKGSPLTNNEVDANFTNLNTDKAELSGATFTGAITTNSTIDGRDVATDGTKLDGIEAGADVTDTAAVTAAGALMDSELTSEASVKALNQGVATTDSPTFAGLITSADISFGDSDKAIFGAGSDLQIYHDGGTSIIADTGTGFLALRGDGNVTLQNAAGTENKLVASSDGAVSLYYDNAVKLATTATGINITGNATFADNGKATFGASDDLQIYHTGSDSRILDTGTGNLRIMANNLRMQSALGEQYIIADDGGAVTAYYDNSAKLATTATGIDVTGTATMDGLTVDGAGDGVKATIGKTGGTNLNIYADTNTVYLAGSPALSTAYIIDQTNNNMQFKVNAAERMRIDSSGNVGIGTSSPLNQLVISEGTGQHGIEFAAGTTSYIQAYDRATSDYGDLKIDAQTIAFGTDNGAERLRIDSSGKIQIGNNIPMWSGSYGGALVLKGNNATSDRYAQLAIVDSTGAIAHPGIIVDTSGNVLVGRTSASFGSDTGLVLRPNNDSYIIANDAPSLTMRRNNSDGDILKFYKDGTTVGSIGTINSALYIGTLSENSGITFQGTALQPTNGVQNRVDNTNDIGSGTYRWDDIYATNGTIQTSDRNEKQDIAELSDAEQRVAVAAKGLLRKFRWKDSVAEKGDEARTHFGIIAQDLQAAFDAEGLDAGDYAMFISTTWTDEETNEEKTRMGVRYSELLAFIIAAL